MIPVLGSIAIFHDSNFAWNNIYANLSSSLCPLPLNEKKIEPGNEVVSSNNDVNLEITQNKPEEERTISE